MRVGDPFAVDHDQTFICRKFELDFQHGYLRVSFVRKKVARACLAHGLWGGAYGRAC
jgi:hypothetical protein